MTDSVSLHRAGIPDYMHEGILEYIRVGRPMGNFLTAVFNNDLREACIRADDANLPILHNYVQWLYANAPVGSWGSPDSTEKWRKKIAESSG